MKNILGNYLMPHPPLIIPTIGKGEEKAIQNTINSCEKIGKEIGDLKPEECVMIGDNLEVDIKVPYEIGMNVYHLNKFGTTNYPTIRKIEDLKERL